MMGNKHFKKIWLAISIVAILAMIFFTILPAFYAL